MAAAGPSLLQTSYGTNGNLELVRQLTSGQLQHWWRDDDHGVVWHAGPTFAANVSSPPCLIQGQFGMSNENAIGNFELCVALNDRTVQHWWRDNTGGTGWHLGATLARTSPPSSACSKEATASTWRLWFCAMTACCSITGEAAGNGTRGCSLAPPAELTLRVDEERRVRLPGGGSAGYQWTSEIDGDPDAIEFHWEPWEPPPTIPPRAPVGGSLDQALVVRGRHQGQAHIRLRLVRLREPDQPPRADYLLTIRVEK